MTPEQAKELLLSNYLYYGVMMVKMGDADGMVSGACHSTADTLRPCLQILKTKPGTKLVSAFFLMVVPNCDMGANGTFIFADAGLEQNPDPEKLANIAISSADSFKLLVEKEPVVAMLSHSTKGSAKHADVDKVLRQQRSLRNSHQSLLLTENFSLMQLSFHLLGNLKHREARLQDMLTYLYSQTLMLVTLDTNLFRDLLKQKLTVL